MKDIFEIEIYREHTIKYDADKDKFFVSLIINDEHTDKKRGSLNDVRKAIDEHIKANLEFKPFTLLFSNYGEATEYKIVSVRSDGGVVLEDKKGQKRTEISAVNDHLKGRNDKFFKFNADYLEWLEKKERMNEMHRKEASQMQKIKPELEPIDMSFVNDFKK